MNDKQGPSIKSTWAPLGIDIESFDDFKIRSTIRYASVETEKLAYLNSLYVPRSDHASLNLLTESCPLAKEVRLAFDQLSLTGCSEYADRLIHGERLAVNLDWEYVQKTNCYASFPFSRYELGIEKELYRERSYEVCCIHHGYDIGDQAIYLRRGESSPDPIRAAIYCQFKCEEWFGSEKMISNLGIGALLIQFYGYTHHYRADAIDICMHSWREHFTTDELYEELTGDTALERAGMRDVIVAHLRG